MNIILPLFLFVKNEEKFAQTTQNPCLEKGKATKGRAMLSWEEAIEPYLETPSIENYELIVNFIRSMGGKYMDETKFQDDPTKRTIENISLLLCY